MPIGSSNFFSVSVASGKTLRVGTIGDILNAKISHLLTTSPGEIPSDLSYGTIVPSLVHTPWNQPIEAMLIENVTEQITKYLPYVQILEMEPVRGERSLTVSLKYTYDLEGAQTDSTLEVIIPTGP